MVKQNGTKELPDLARANEIVPKNLRAVQTIYIAAMLEVKTVAGGGSIGPVVLVHAC